MGQSKKGGRKPRKGLDEIDIKIIALKAANPRITLKEIGEKVGLHTTTVWERLQRMPEQDWLADARVELESMVGLALKNYRDRLDSYGDRGDSAADKLLAGLGLLNSKHTHEVRGSLVLSAEAVAEFLQNCDTETYDKIRAGLAGRPPEPNA